MELFFSIFTTVSIFIFSFKGHHNKLQKLYNEKLVPANLAEKIEFKDNNKQSKTGNKKSISMVVLKLHQK